MKAGIGAEICANPVFFNKNVGSEHELGEILNLLRKRFLLLFIHDLASNASLHPTSGVMPYTDESIIDTRGYTTIDDYLTEHHNLKKKLKDYQKIGGRVEVLEGILDSPEEIPFECQRTIGIFSNFTKICRSETTRINSTMNGHSLLLRIHILHLFQ